MYSPLQKRVPNQWILLLLLVVVTAGFFLPVSSKGMLGSILKLSLFMLTLAGGYVLFRALNTDDFMEDSEEDETDEKVLIHDDESSAEYQWDGFGAAFRTFSRDFINVLRQTLVASCAGFYVEKASGILELHTGDTHSGGVDEGAVVPPGNIIEKVCQDKQPVVLPQVASNVFLPGLIQQELQSLICIPLLWKHESVGVLTLGSETPGNFSTEDQTLLVRYGQLLLSAMSDYHRALSTELNQEVYRVHLAIMNSMRDCQDEESAGQSFMEHLQSLFGFDQFALCIRQGEEGVIRQISGLIDDMDVGTVFPLDDGLAGWVIKRHAPLLVPDLYEGSYRRPRFIDGENKKHGMRCFLGIPLGNNQEAWGAVIIESHIVNHYNEKTKTALSQLSLFLEATLSRLAMQK